MLDKSLRLTATRHVFLVGILVILQTKAESTMVFNGFTIPEYK